MRQTALVFALFYLISSFGYGLEVHYCLGRVSDINYVLFETHCACDDAGMIASKRCCEEQSFFNQIDAEHSAPAVVEVGKVLQPTLFITSFDAYAAQDASVSSATDWVDRGPPRVRDLTIEFARLLTYG